jgi:hypothetical protein
MIWDESEVAVDGPDGFDGLLGREGGVGGKADCIQRGGRVAPRSRRLELAGVGGSGPIWPSAGMAVYSCHQRPRQKTTQKNETASFYQIKFQKTPFGPGRDRLCPEAGRCRRGWFLAPTRGRERALQRNVLDEGGSRESWHDLTGL